MKTWLVISTDKEFNFPITSLNLHRRDVFQFGFWKRDSFTNLNVIIAITREFCLPVQFSICVNSQNAQLYKFPRELLELCMSTRECLKRISSLQFARQKVFESHCWTWAFGLVEWLSVWVRQVPSAILRMTHFTNCCVTLSLDSSHNTFAFRSGRIAHFTFRFPL